MQKEVFAAARTVAEYTTFGELLVLGNQNGVSLLATALFAVQVATKMRTPFNAK